MTPPAPWPHGQDRWHAFAAALNARMALLQLHVESDWLFALCTVCGWDLECSRPEISRFRFESAAHICPPPAPIVVPVPAVLEEVLF